MSLMEHLAELRWRLFKAALGIAVGAVLGYVFFPQIFEFLKAPYCALPPETRPNLTGGCNLLAFGPLDQFAVRLKVAMISGVVLSSPIWFYQLWAFITPGLHKHEKRFAWTFVVSATLLFILGAAMAYYTLGKGLEFLLSIAPGTITALQVTKYLSYVTAMLLVFGVSFEFPLIVVMLNRIGAVTHAKLTSLRRPIIFGVFVFAAIATPSQDPITMCGMAIPMSLLFEASLVITRFHDRRKAKRERVEAAGLGLTEADLDNPSDISEYLARDPGGTGSR